jgi:hypothetical protein
VRASDGNLRSMVVSSGGHQMKSRIYRTSSASKSLMAIVNSIDDHENNLSGDLKIALKVKSSATRS